MNEKEKNFILRRATWHGRVNRDDVKKALDVSNATATRLLSECVHDFPALVRRMPKWIECIPFAWLPHEISAQTMLDLMLRNDKSKDFFAITGLDFNEARVLRTQFKSDIFTGTSISIADRLLRSIIIKSVVSIHYVGLKLGENARWRMVMPVAFHVMQGQWRIAAHDMEDGKCTLKFFVVSRILDARQPEGVVKSKCKRETGEIKLLTYKIKLNGRMTEDQKKAIKQELAINENNEIMMAREMEFDFRKLYMDNEIQSSENIVWPLVVDLIRVN